MYGELWLKIYIKANIPKANPLIRYLPSFCLNILIRRCINIYFEFQYYICTWLYRTWYNRTWLPPCLLFLRGNLISKFLHSVCILLLFWYYKLYTWYTKHYIKLYKLNILHGIRKISDYLLLLLLLLL